MVEKGERQLEGIGVIEAPCDTFFYHYQINEEGLVTKANLIVSTTRNIQAMNESVRSVANQYLDGHEITGALLNHLEAQCGLMISVLRVRRMRWVKYRCR